MKTNALVTEIIRGKWVLEMSAVPHFEKLANDLLKQGFDDLDDITEYIRRAYIED